MRRAVPTVLALVLTLAGPRPADACSCVRISSATDMQNADAVFFGRAGQRVVRGGLEEQAIKVLHVLKGKPGATFLLRRQGGVISTCDRHFDPDEVALVFARQGAVGVCAGNYALEVQAPRLPEYFALAEVKPTPTPLPALEAAIARGLGAELKGVAEVPVLDAALAGTVGRAGSTRLVFAKEVPGTNGLTLRAAESSGPVHHVAGEWLQTGTKFETVLYGARAPYQVLGAWVKRNPAREAVLEVSRLVASGNAARWKPALLALVQRSLQGGTGPTGPRARTLDGTDDLKPAALFRWIGSIREALLACQKDSAWQQKDHRGPSPASWARHLLALWYDPRDEGQVRTFLAERKDFARAAPAGLEGKTLTEALNRYADQHFAREGYKDKKKRPPNHFSTTLAPDGDRALVRHWVEYLHWGYAQELVVTKQADRWRVRLVMFAERWHNR
ncbi:MAG: hypothetical protein HY906_14385 [Deltaproteobacteria bacterium]|nr:hypothetical protein [Deltaproteobacteria bacterium]